MFQIANFAGHRESAWLARRDDREYCNAQRRNYAADAPRFLELHTGTLVLSGMGQHRDHMGRCRGWIITLIHSGILVAAAMAPPTVARAATQRYRIEAENLGVALNQFSLQSGRHILVLSQLVREAHAPTIVGDFTAEEALERLLAGSGLDYRVIEDGVILITPAAEPASQSRPVSAPGEADLASVVVTALRRTSLAEDTAASIEVFDAAELDSFHIRQPADISELTPGLTFEQTGFGGQQRPSLRGIHSVGEATVGVYYDDAPLTGPAGTAVDPSGMTPQFSLYDVTRVEVLKGPQGTLYGSGSMGGTERVLFAAPEMNVLHGEVSGTASATQDGGPGGEAVGVVNVPLVSDRLAMRVVGYDRKVGGYIDDPLHHLDDINDEIDRGLRWASRLELTEEISASVTAARQWSHIGSSFFWTSAAGPYVSRAGALTPFDGDLGLYGLSLKSTGAVLVTANLYYYRWSSVRNIDASQLTLSQRSSPTGCAAYANLSADQFCTPSELAGYAAFVDSWSPAVLLQPLLVNSRIGEIRASSETGSLSWTGGAYVERRVDSGSSRTLHVDSATGASYAPTDFLGLRFFANQFDQQAAFGQATYAFGENLFLTAGVRLYQYDKWGEGDEVTANPVLSVPASSLIDAHVHDGGDSPMLAVGSRPWSGGLLYLQRADGFRPGGVNVIPELAAAQTTYRPDKLRSYELGLKQTWDQSRYSLNVAAYRTDWSDLQYSTTTTNGGYYFITNIGTARILGMDFDVDANLYPFLTLKASLTVLRARLTDALAIPAVLGGGAAGDRLPMTPSVSASLTARYQRPLSGSLRLTGAFTAAYVGSSYSDYSPANPYYESMGSVLKIDCGVGIESSRWGASLFVDNALDADRPLQNTFSAGALPQSLSYPPRTFTLALRRSF